MQQLLNGSKENVYNLYGIFQIICVHDIRANQIHLNLHAVQSG